MTSRPPRRRGWRRRWPRAIELHLDPDPRLDPAADLRGDARRVLAARVVAREHDAIGARGGDPHGRALVPVAIPAGAEHHDQRARAQSARDRQGARQGVRRMGIVDHHARPRPLRATAPRSAPGEPGPGPARRRRPAQAPRRPWRRPARPARSRRTRRRWRECEARAVRWPARRGPPGSPAFPPRTARLPPRAAPAHPCRAPRGHGVAHDAHARRHHLGQQLRRGRRR